MFDRTGVKVTSSGLIGMWYTTNNRYGAVRRHYKLTRGNGGSSHGYLSVTLNRTRVLSHRVIALLFLGQPPSRFMVNHKNGIKTDNRPENLEWVSQADNNRHATYELKSERRKPIFDHVKALRLISEGWSQSAVARKFNVTPSAVFRIFHKGERRV